MLGKTFYESTSIISRFVRFQVGINKYQDAVEFNMLSWTTFGVNLIVNREVVKLGRSSSTSLTFVLSQLFPGVAWVQSFNNRQTNNRNLYISYKPETSHREEKQNYFNTKNDRAHIGELYYS